MKRREFIIGAVASPIAAQAQQSERMPRIVVMTNAPEASPQGREDAEAFRRGLEELGWTDGQNIRIDFHWGVGETGREQIAKDVVSIQPKLIVCSTSPITAALSMLTGTIPIVFVNVTEPAAQGLVSSDAHPGGNVTGFSNFESSMGSKWLEIPKEIDPGIQRVAILFNPDTAPAHGNFFLPSFQAASRTLGIRSIETPLHDPTEIEPALETFAREANGGVVMMPDVFTGGFHRDQIIRSALNHRLPVISGYGLYTEVGGLVSYGISVGELFHRAASYVDRILKGEKPGDLPVQAPTKFEMVINLKTAKAIGIDIPPTLLARADKVIE
jgi:putative tryptophan/tyrosine transport system substrate-binding protein